MASSNTLYTPRRSLTPLQMRRAKFELDRRSPKYSEGGPNWADAPPDAADEVRIRQTLPQKSRTRPDLGSTRLVFLYPPSLSVPEVSLYMGLKHTTAVVVVVVEVVVAIVWASYAGNTPASDGPRGSLALLPSLEALSCSSSFQVRLRSPWLLPTPCVRCGDPPRSGPQMQRTRS